jgi:hypothetical protein
MLSIRTLTVIGIGDKPLILLIRNWLTRSHAILDHFLM